MGFYIYINLSAPYLCNHIKYLVASKSGDAVIMRMIFMLRDLFVSIEFGECFVLLRRLI